jgi:hypothetical protein
MENLKIEVEETKTYWQRMRKAFFWNFIIIVSAFLFVILTENNNNSIKIAFLISAPLVLFGMSAFSVDALCTYYVTDFEIKENTVHITYKKRNEPFELNDSIEKFNFKQGNGSVMNGQTPYLEINYKDNLTIRQYNKWTWEKDSFFQAIEFLKGQNLLFGKYFFGLIERKRKP